MVYVHYGYLAYYFGYGCMGFGLVPLAQQLPGNSYFTLTKYQKNGKIH